jgi:hypothetical protein
VQEMENFQFARGQGGEEFFLAFVHAGDFTIVRLRMLVANIRCAEGMRNHQNPTAHCVLTHVLRGFEWCVVTGN